MTVHLSPMILGGLILQRLFNFFFVFASSRLGVRNNFFEIYQCYLRGSKMEENKC